VKYILGAWLGKYCFTVLLVAGDKSGGSEKKFYRQLIIKADGRFDDHLVSVKKKARK